MQYNLFQMVVVFVILVKMIFRAKKEHGSVNL